MQLFLAFGKANTNTAVEYTFTT